jgi:hypothetical protein
VKTLGWPAVAGARPEAEALIREARQRQRKRRWLVAVTASAVVAVAVTIVDVGGGPPLHRPAAQDHPPPSRTAMQTLRVDWRDKVPAGVASITLADGSLWVAGFGAVTRIDPMSGRLIARISTPRAGDSPDVISFNGSIWVSSGGFGDSVGTLYKIDPSSNTVAMKFRTPGQPTSLTAGAGRLWVDIFGNGGDALRPFDPRTGTFLPVIVTSVQGVGPPAFGLGSVWITSDGAQVWRIDPADMRASRFWPRPSSPVQPSSNLGQPGQVAIAQGSVWITFGTEIGRFDPATGRLESTLTVAKADGVVLQPGGTSVWALMQTGSSDPDIYLPDPRQPGRIGRIDPRTGAFAGSMVDIGSSGGYDSLAASPTMAWVGDRYNSIVIAVASAPAG